MSSQSQQLFTQFQTNLNKHQKLSRDMVFKVAKETIDGFFASQPVAASIIDGSSMITSVTTSTKKTKTPKEPSGPPTQWHKIISNKELGVTTFFKHDYEELKSATGNINYFTAIKSIRTKYENTPHWKEYQDWVRKNHPAPDTIKDSDAATDTTATASTVVAPVTA